MSTGNNPLLPKLSPITIKERVSLVYVEKGNLDVLDGAFVVVDINGVRTHIPVGGVSCLMLEPGTRISHAAVALAARVGCLICWIGEAGVRLYSAGQPGGARADRLLYQARLALDEDARLKVVRQMYRVRFGDDPPEKRSVSQLRGIEGARVRQMYKLFAKRFSVPWKYREYDPDDWNQGDLPNRCLSAATAALYGITRRPLVLFTRVSPFRLCMILPICLNLKRLFRSRFRSRRRIRSTANRMSGTPAGKFSGARVFCRGLFP